jgi:hypothetical protein
MSRAADEPAKRGGSRAAQYPRRGSACRVRWPTVWNAPRHCVMWGAWGGRTVRVAVAPPEPHTPPSSSLPRSAHGTRARTMVSHASAGVPRAWAGARAAAWTGGRAWGKPGRNRENRRSGAGPKPEIQVARRTELISRATQPTAKPFGASGGATHAALLG